MATRLLKESEVEFARQVFEDKLPYGKVYLSSRFFPFNEGTAVTVASIWLVHLYAHVAGATRSSSGRTSYDEGARRARASGIPSSTS